MSLEGTLVDINRINWKAIWRLVSMLSLFDEQNCSEKLIDETGQWMERYRGTHEATIAITLVFAREELLDDVYSFTERWHDTDIAKRNMKLLGGGSMRKHEYDQEKHKECVEKIT